MMRLVHTNPFGIRQLAPFAAMSALAAGSAPAVRIRGRAAP